MDININQITAKITLPILNIQIYLNLRNSILIFIKHLDNINLALQLIKRRRILNSMALNNNKTLLKITK